MRHTPPPWTEHGAVLFHTAQCANADQREANYARAAECVDVCQGMGREPRQVLRALLDCMEELTRLRPDAPQLLAFVHAMNGVMPPQAAA